MEEGRDTSPNFLYRFHHREGKAQRLLRNLIGYPLDKIEGWRKSRLFYSSMGLGALALLCPGLFISASRIHFRF